MKTELLFNSNDHELKIISHVIAPTFGKMTFTNKQNTGNKMKAKIKIAISVLTLGVSALMLMAQDNGNRPSGNGRPSRGEESGKPGGPGHRPPPPVIAVLDANHDGVLDMTEIANASKALLTLDKNGDGQLTREELRPPRPEGDAGGPPAEGDDRPPQGPPDEN